MLTRSNKGFTLVEVLVIVLIIGIISAIAAPSWIRFLDTLRLNAAQEKVYLAFRETQNQAKRTRTTWQISFREYRGDVEWAVHPATLDPYAAKWNALDRSVRLDPETTLQMTHGVRQIKFNFRGAVRQPPLGRITLSSKSGGAVKRCVFVSTILGALRTAQEQPTPQDGKYCY